jgi:hypothetical protein
MSPAPSAALLVPAAALLIAAAQLALVHTHGLSRWRLGGFGMYSDYHPEHLQLWHIRQGTPALITATTPLLPTCPQPTAERCLRLANAACLAHLHACLPDAASGDRVELWRPQTAPGAMQRVLVTSWTAP